MLLAPRVPVGGQSTQAFYANGLNGCFSAAPRVLGWVACGLWGMLMDLSGVAVQQESAELMSALVFDGGGWQ